MIKKTINLLRKPCSLDLWIILGFVILSLFLSFGRIGLHFNDYLFSGSDAANISSFAAALDHPQLFTKDPLLKNPDNFAFYNTVHIPLIRWLGQIFGNYSSPFALMVIPTTFLHLLGYYWLGKTVFKGGFWATIFSLMALVPINLNLGEYWGLFRDVIPRFLFESLLPFLLVALIRWGKNSKSWPWLMAVTGLFVYVHPVSLPAWGLAILSSLWILSSKLPIRLRIKRILFSALIFLVVITPFTVNYLSTTTFGSKDTGNYEEILGIMRTRFIPGFLDLNLGISDFIKTAVISDWFIFLIWLFIAFGGIILLLKRRKHNNQIGLILAVWWASVLVVGIFIPVLDHNLAYYMKRMPLEVDLIRSLRYIIPLLLLTACYLLSEYQSNIGLKINIHSKRTMNYGFIGLGLLFLAGWALRNDFLHDPTFVQSAKCWVSGKIACEFKNEFEYNQRIDLLKAIKSKTPSGSRIMTSRGISELEIRYFSLRPLVYSKKDGGSLIYANHQDLLVWWQQYLEINQLETLNTRRPYLSGLTEFSRKYSADYLVLSESFSNNEYYPPGLDIVFYNSSYSLFKVVYQKY